MQSSNQGIDFYGEIHTFVIAFKKRDCRICTGFICYHGFLERREGCLIFILYYYNYTCEF
jgi:hypothetical protein